MLFPKKALLHQALAVLPIVSVSLISGCTMGWIPIALYDLQSPNSAVEITQKGGAMLVASSQVGRMVTAIPVGMLTEKFGRRPACVLSGCIFCITWMFLNVARTLTALQALFFLLGVAIGIADTLNQIYSAELVSASLRAMFSCLILCSNCLGAVIITILGIYLSYQTTVLVIFLISLTYYLSAYWQLESPVFLLSKSKDSRAKKNLLWLRKDMTQISIETEFIQMKTGLQIQTRQAGGWNWIKPFKNKPDRKCMALMFLINFLALFTGPVVIKINSPFILPLTDFVSNPSTYPFLLSLLETVFAVSSFLFMDKFGRRSLLLLPSLLISIMNFSTAVLIYVKNNSSTPPSYLDELYLTVIFVSYSIFYGCIFPVLTAVRSDSLVHNLREVSFSVTTIAQAAAVLISVIVFQQINVLVGLYLNFIIFGTFSLLLAICTHFFVPEMRGQTLKDMQESFRKKCRIYAITLTNFEKITE